MKSGRSLAATAELAGVYETMRVDDYRRILSKVREESLRLGVTYQPEDKPVEVTNLVLIPFLLDSSEIALVRRTVGMFSAFSSRVPLMRSQIPELKRLLSLAEDEEEFFRDCGYSTRPAGHDMVGRWDLNIDRRPGGSPVIRLFEGNGTAVGGLNYAPASEMVVANATGFALNGRDGRRLSIARTGDLHADFHRMMESHARSLGGGLRGFTILEDRSWTAGITEAPYIVEEFDRRGVAASLSDPRDLSIRNGGLYAKGRQVDVVYRNIEVREILEIERESGRLEAMREAFRRNMVVSSLAGEFDHKSLLEVMLHPEVLKRLPPENRAVFKKCVPWTRLLRHRRCAGPSGKPVDLPSYVLKNRESLVMKPNRSCGGDGVTIGKYATQERWERVLGRALKHEDTWVAQEHITPAVIPVPAESRSRVVVGHRYANCGVLTVPGGPHILGRSSSMPVVNVARGGGIVAVMKVRW
jgi:hypothetical protein